MTAPTASPVPTAPPDVATWPTLVRLTRRFAPVRGWAVGVLAILILRTALELVGAPLMGRAIDALKPAAGQGSGLPDAFVTWLWALAVVLVLRNLVTFLATVTTQSLGQELENRFRSELFAKVARLHFRYHDANRSGATIARSLRDMEKAKHFFREVGFGYVELTLVAVGIVAFTFAEHWSYGVVMALAVGGACGMSVRTGAEIARRDRAVSDHYDGVSTVLQENVAGARVVRAFGREPEEVEKFGGRLGDFTGAWRGVARFWTTRMPGIHSLYNLAIPAVLLVGVARVRQGAGSVGEVASVLFFVSLMRNRMRLLTRLVISGQEAVASASRVFEVLDHEEEVRPPAEPRTLPPRGGEVVLDDVWFGHRGDLHVLCGLSLRVPAGASLGIIGPTGSGKSTLVSLLPRYYDPDRGRVLLDGIDVRELDPLALRRAVGLVFQEPFLFSATVRENLRYGRPDATDAEIEDAARLAAAHDFVAALPKGYDTLVGERGVSLSGGQRQRLTIARALVMDPRVLVFDDATASVDAVTEKTLFEGIRAAARGRTALVVSQRVTSVRWCDRIAVVEAGRVTAEGSHAELLGRSRVYREIAEHQSLVRAGGAS